MFALKKKVFIIFFLLRKFGIESNILFCSIHVCDVCFYGKIISFQRKNEKKF